MTIDFVEGTTIKERFRLEDDATAVNGSGMNAPELVLRDKGGQLVSTSGATAWASAASGTVDVDMGALALTAARSPYRARFKLVDQLDDIAFYPNAKDGDLWHVHPA